MDGYVAHGIELREDAVVIDIGANIGLFGVRLMQRLPGARVVACEPIPAIHDVLARNAARHGDGRMTALRCGVSNQPGTMTFTYFPRSPALSSAHLEDWDDPGAFTAAVRGALGTAGEVSVLARWTPRWLAGFVAKFLWSDREEVTADLYTVSQLMVEQNLARIDLLKIDCEGAELMVLQGVDDTDWPRIHQVVAEVHDRQGRLKEVTDLLTQRGLTQIHIEHEEGFENTDLFNVYATRNGP